MPIPSPQRLRGHVLAVGAALVLTLGLAAPPAAAQGKHHQHDAYYQPPTAYHNVGDFDPECADVDVTATYDYAGVDSLRNVPGSDGQAFLYKDTYRFSEVWKEASTGEVLFTQRGQYRFEEVKAKRVDASAVPSDVVPPEGLVGPIYRFTSVQKGHDTIRDARGKVLYRTAGVVIAEELHDTLGDREPGGEILSVDYLKVWGPHPLLDVNLCDVAAELAG